MKRLETDRRDVLKLALGGATALALPLGACGGGAAPGAEDLATEELADGVVLITGAGGNVVAARAPEGAILIDGGDALHAEALEAAALKALGAKDVARLFNTHWHPDQTGSNERLGKRGVPIVAHENTRLWLDTTVWVRWQDKTYTPLPAAAQPTETFYGYDSTPHSMPLGEKGLDYGLLFQAHTDGDIYVFLKDANVLVAGGTASGAGWPIIDWSTGGWYGGMVDALTAMRDLADENTRIIPADGRILTRDDLDAQITMHNTILERMADDLKASRSPDEVLDRKPTAEFDAEMGDPTQFVQLAFESLWTHVRMDPRVRAI
jgi:cyclase